MIFARIFQGEGEERERKWRGRMEVVQYVGRSSLEIVLFWNGEDFSRDGDGSDVE